MTDQIQDADTVQADTVPNDPAQTEAQKAYVFDWIGSPLLAYEHACYAVKAMLTKDIRPTRTRLEAVLFIADVDHLNEYGRPLYGENWRAGWSGPVPTILGSVLDGDDRLHGLVHDDDIRMIAFARESLGGEEGFRHAFREPNVRKMSRSDREAIRGAVESMESFDPCDLIRTLRFHPAQLVGVGNRIPPTSMFRQDDPDLEAKIAQTMETLPYVSFLRPLEEN